MQVGRLAPRVLIVILLPGYRLDNKSSRFTHSATEEVQGFQFSTVKVTVVA